MLDVVLMLSVEYRMEQILTLKSQSHFASL